MYWKVTVKVYENGNTYPEEIEFHFDKLSLGASEFISEIAHHCTGDRIEFVLEPIKVEEIEG